MSPIQRVQVNETNSKSTIKRVQFNESAVDSVASVASAVYDQVSQLVPVQQVDDIDEVHQLDPVHQVVHKNECSKIKSGPPASRLPH